MIRHAAAVVVAAEHERFPADRTGRSQEGSRRPAVEKGRKGLGKLAQRRIDLDEAGKERGEGPELDQPAPLARPARLEIEVRLGRRRAGIRSRRGVGEELQGAEENGLTAPPDGGQNDTRASSGPASDTKATDPAGAEGSRTRWRPNGESVLETGSRRADSITEFIRAKV
jgi:hypothetical protein